MKAARSRAWGNGWAPYKPPVRPEETPKLGATKGRHLDHAAEPESHLDGQNAVESATLAVPLGAGPGLSCGAKVAAALLWNLDHRKAHAC